MRNRSRTAFVTLFLAALLLWVRSGAATADPLALSAHAAGKPLLMGHYLPWYEADPNANTWGWHWTMLHFDPSKIVNGQREIASQYHPLIEPYDSNDPDAQECQAQLMKLAGLDGAIIDWTGSANDIDYPINLRNAYHFMRVLNKAHLRYAVCYEEDVTLKRLIADGKIAPDGTVAQVKSDMEWLEKNGFSQPGYVRLNGAPVLLTFGGGTLNGGQWNQALSSLPVRLALFSENVRRDGAVGAFAWPLPQGGTASAMQVLNAFPVKANGWPHSIGMAFPGFHDIYREAGVGASYGFIDDDNGRTYATTLANALKSSAEIVQVATWNDWGEGTIIEPSVERGYRELETTQRLRKQWIDPAFRYTPADLRLPVRLYQLRKKYAHDAVILGKLTDASDALFADHLDDARAMLRAFSYR